MDMVTKNKISHRGRALEALRNGLVEEGKEDEGKVAVRKRRSSGGDAGKVEAAKKAKEVKEEDNGYTPAKA